MVRLLAGPAELTAVLLSSELKSSWSLLECLSHEQKQVLELTGMLVSWTEASLGAYWNARLMDRSKSWSLLEYSSHGQKQVLELTGMLVSWTEASLGAYWNARLMDRSKSWSLLECLSHDQKQVSECWDPHLSRMFS